MALVHAQDARGHGADEAAAPHNRVEAPDLVPGEEILCGAELGGELVHDAPGQLLHGDALLRQGAALRVEGELRAGGPGI